MPSHLCTLAKILGGDASKPKLPFRYLCGSLPLACDAMELWALKLVQRRTIPKRIGRSRFVPQDDNIICNTMGLHNKLPHFNRADLRLIAHPLPGQLLAADNQAVAELDSG